jgi:hypothetical protein
MREIEYIDLINIESRDNKRDKILLYIGYLSIYIAFWWFLSYWLPNYVKADKNIRPQQIVQGDLNIGMDVLYKNDSMYIVEKKIDTIYVQSLRY